MLIVGVAPDVRHDLFERDPEPHIYLPSGGSDSTPHVRLRARGRAAGRATPWSTTVREQLRAVDANLPVMFVKSFRAQHEAQRAGLDPARRGARCS